MRPANPPEVRSLGDLLDLAFRQYRADFRFVISAAVWILLPFLLLSSVSTYKSAKNVSEVVTQLVHGGDLASLTKPLQGTNGQLLGLGGIVGVLSTLLANALLYGAILHRVAARALAGDDVPLARCVAHALRRLLSVWLSNLFAVVLWWVPVTACWFVAIGAVAAVAGARAPMALVDATGVVLCIAAAGFTVWWSVRFAMVSSAAREDRRILWGAVARSWALTRRNAWRTLAYVVLTYLMAGVIELGLQAASAITRVPAVTVAVSGLSQLFVTPWMMLAIAWLYVDLRIRADGLDLAAWLREHAPAPTAQADGGGG